MARIRINVGRQSDGCTYMLHPLDAREIHQKYPGIKTAPRIFVGYETQSDFEDAHRTMWMQIATMLTGLSAAQLRKLGGAVIYDPVSERELAEVA